MKAHGLQRWDETAKSKPCILLETEPPNAEPSGKTLGLDVGLKSFYTDSEGRVEPNPRFYRKAEQALRTLQRQVSRKVKGSNNRKKAVSRLARKHLQVQRQRKDHAIKLARCVVASHDVVVFEDLLVKNMIKNRKPSKSIQDAGWREFRHWLESFARIMGRMAISVNPAYTSQMCSGCGLHLDRDHNAAINILRAGLRMVGHTRMGSANSETLVETEEDPFSGASV